MKRSLAFLFSFGTLLLLFSSCERSAYYGMKEGKVVYEMELVGDKLDPMMKAMMPSEVTTFFADGKSCMVMEGGAGFFENRLLLDPEKKLFATLTSFMGNKTARVMHTDSLAKDMADSKSEITYTGVKKEIAGIMCEEAVLKGDSGSTYRVFYTDELDVKAPDMASTMFSEIEGMLMEYQIDMPGFKMKMTAKKISADKPDSTLFTIPKEYEIKKINQ